MLSTCLSLEQQNVLPAQSQFLLVAACSASSALLSWRPARHLESIVHYKVYLFSKYRRQELLVHCSYTTYRNTPKKQTHLNTMYSKLQSLVLQSNCFTNSAFRLSTLTYLNNCVRTGCDRETECSVSSMLLTVLVQILSEWLLFFSMTTTVNTEQTDILTTAKKF